MVRKYEIAFLIREGETVKPAIKRIKEYLEKNQATIKKESDMGTRELAYELIKNREKFRKAFYYFVNAEVDPANLFEFETKLKYDGDVLRYMVFAEK
jgi:ribosomal protein S6